MRLFAKKVPIVRNIQKKFHYDVSGPHNRHTVNLPKTNPVEQVFPVKTRFPLISKANDLKFYYHKQSSCAIGRNKICVCCLDVSDLMQLPSEYSQKDPKFSKWDLAKVFMKDIIDSMQNNDELAIVTCENVVKDIMPLTKMNLIGKTQAEKLLNSIVLGGGENIFAGINACANIIERISPKMPSDIHIIIFSSRVNDKLSDEKGNLPIEMWTPGNKIIWQSIIV